VRPFGLCRDLSAIEHWCAAREVALVIDSAAALGGRLPAARPAGGQGKMETFSLHATKVFAVGEGGAVACAPEYEAALRRTMNFGLDAGGWHAPGLNAKMSELAAAVGLAQDRAFDTQVAIRREAADRYCAFLRRHAPGWGLPTDTGLPPWQTFPLLAPDAARAEALEAAAATEGIQVRRYYRPALHVAAAGAPYARGPLPVSADLAARMVCLPMYSDWAPGEQDTMLASLAAALEVCA